MRAITTTLPGLVIAALSSASCSDSATLAVDAVSGTEPRLVAPDESLIPIINVASARGWPDGAAPVPAEGLAVSRYAAGLDHPRWLYTLPNGDVLVAETNAPPRPDDQNGIAGWLMKRAMKRAGAAVPSANRITLLRDEDGDGVAEFRSAFLENLNSPFGMALIGDTLYIANTDEIVSVSYEEGATRIDAAPSTVAPLPAGSINHHWTKNIIASPDGRRLYATVGSNSNIAENGMDNEKLRAAILEVDLETADVSLFASGLRNPNGLAWEPQSGELWTTVNERDGLGGDLVPDYMTSVSRDSFYGWPYSYYGGHLDERVTPQRPDLVAEAIVPDYALGPHTASLGLVFYAGGALPASYSDGAFVAQHGSWNREPASGYRVVFVRFEGGEPVGKPVDALTGFLSDDGEAFGRPVGLAISDDGALLVADDVGNSVWRLTGK